jgi:hypothetical protein
LFTNSLIGPTSVTTRLPRETNPLSVLLRDPYLCESYHLGIKEIVKQQAPQDIERVERLFVGEDSTSVGSLFTQAAGTTPQIETPTHTIITPNNISTSTKSVGTTLTIEDVDRRMNLMTNELTQIKDMLQQLTQNSTPTGHQPMEIVTDSHNKRKAGDADAATCSNP